MDITTTTPIAQAYIDYLGYMSSYGVADAAIILDNYRQAIAAELSAGKMDADAADWEAAYIEAAAGIISARMSTQDAPQEAADAEAEQQPTETENAPQAATQAAEGTDEKKEAEAMTTAERAALERINARQNAANRYTNITPADIAAELAAMEAEQAAPAPDPDAATLAPAAAQVWAENGEIVSPAPNAEPETVADIWRAIHEADAELQRVQAPDYIQKQADAMTWHIPDTDWAAIITAALQGVEP